jgi:large subunit ribosomal protein L31
MKKGIHPKYVTCKVHCACGNEFETRATVPELTIDICNACHPFYTGKQKFVDTAGRVQKFMERYGNYRKKQPADESTADTAETPAS